MQQDCCSAQGARIQPVHMEATQADDNPCQEFCLSHAAQGQNSSNIKLIPKTLMMLSGLVQNAWMLLYKDLLFLFAHCKCMLHLNDLKVLRNIQTISTLE